ncbi:glycosyl hydrolase [Leeuwenhoekiella sp. W20_SRS_FM14]|uniref:glycosyl hydrolase n=1 Tax=Leeuwenhoekiella sp. W20_SRS_FM14 TaxID=3240270 RepID=UPI003F9D06D7
MTYIKPKFLLILSALLVFLSCKTQEHQEPLKNPIWPELTNTIKPWTRWWWMGSAVDKPNLKKHLIAFQEAGLGGVEITPIYGVKGEEANFLDHLSPKWLEMLDYTISTADSLGLGVDMVLGTGWPYGGPQVTKEFAATKLVVSSYTIKKGVTFTSAVHPPASEKQPAVFSALLAYDIDGNLKDLTTQVSDGTISWENPDADYTVYALFTGKTGQQVKRSAPGGAGYTLDHYSNEAFEAYVKPYDSAFAKLNGNLRAIFNDSYEVYGTDFTPKFFSFFEEHRGYDLKQHINLLLSEEDEELGNRVKADYRLTISELLLTQFDEPWTKWANTHNFKTKLQAHGSPGNLIDLYASADIPECETFGSMPYDIKCFRREAENIRTGDADPVMLKFSSSAGHIAGKPLISSETFTWLREHFKTALSQTKPEAEELLLNGVNHIFLHGSTYSPERAGWPGWKFYASVNFSPNTTIWEDVPALFSYLTNVQSVLQEGKPDNETLLYWPIQDEWNKFQHGKLFFEFKIHSLEEWLLGTPFYKTTQELMKKGYGVDFLSDDFLKQATVVDGKIVLPGGTYKSLVVPDTDFMPLATLQKLIELKNQGASVLFRGLPESVPGFYKYVQQTQELKSLIETNSLSATDLETGLQAASVYPETLVNTGLKFIRRDVDGSKIYYLVNHTANAIDHYIPLAGTVENVMILDPLTRKAGAARIKKANGVTSVNVQIASGDALILKTNTSIAADDWVYTNPINSGEELTNPWKILFEKGGPILPEAVEMKSLKSWTILGKEAEEFSGTAVYTTTFKTPDVEADAWRLDLGDVRESAAVWLDEVYIGTAWSVPYVLDLGKLDLGKHTLKIKVTNLAANRLRAKELRGEEWKIFYEINMVNKDYKPFDATVWEPTPSGLLSPVKLIPLKTTTN